MEAKRAARAAWRLIETACAMAERETRKSGDHSVRNHLEEIQIHTEGYAEPGYSGDVIATGNWNTVDAWDNVLKDRVDLPLGNLPKRLGDAFERLGIEIKWSDEWTTCDECGKLVRTSPDSYGWKRSYVLTDDGVTCHECVTADETRIEETLRALEGNDREYSTLDVDPEEYGYVKVNDEPYESGLHPGQNDSPAAVAKELRARGIERFLFTLDEPSQFYVRWSAYVHEDEADKLPESE